MCYSFHIADNQGNVHLYTYSNVHPGNTVVTIVFVEKPGITLCELEANHLDVSITYDPNITGQDSKYHQIKHVEIGFHDSAIWHPLDHKEGSDYTPQCVVTLLPCLHSTERGLQIAITYMSCSTPVFSKPVKIQQPATCTSEPIV